ncbi:DNA-3-methyladenine glycosylase [Levilactobacillus bambusae]|uniref:Putative 3-methyladenine DNA glycosylase n=1 Tax=Levilactobacillus bambusae TaxID=2024736 RepID=A0A2V1N4N8_9LACO|nr:DNA-3-methyladenine glycosylase [Levilactobacillus bambusae]PWG00750.1 3-methyladenine DNA glycosylase [Levilactobacillus bambusae]
MNSGIVDNLREQPTPVSARTLLGQYLVFYLNDRLMSGWIVETEAYVGINDRACHAFGDRHTKANAPLYEEAGTLYTPQMRGLTMLNIITQPAGEPQGILIRAVEPDQGINWMLERRPKEGPELTNGPAKFTQAFGITKQMQNQILGETNLRVDQSMARQPAVITSGPRVGIPNKGDWTTANLRYTVAGNPYVSKQRKRDMNWTTYGWLNKELEAEK